MVKVYHKISIISLEYKMRHQKENAHRWYIKHKAEARRKTREYNRKNPEKAAIRSRRYREKCLELLAYIKQSQGCAICGYNKCSRALDFHHVNPKDKKFNCSINNFQRKSAEVFAIEIQKCILLCRNCHSEIHEIVDWGKP